MVIPFRDVGLTLSGKVEVKVEVEVKRDGFVIALLGYCVIGCF